MEVASLGYQTDLALLRLGGSQVSDLGDYLVIRSPHNPTFMWGNFLLLPSVPPREQTQHWLQTFDEAFPDASHRAMGFDGVDGSVDDLAGFAASGMSVEGSAVMTATQVRGPPHPNREAEYRPLATDDDWCRRLELRMACRDDEDGDDEAYRTFATAKAATMRALVDAGHGRWFGAFVEGELLSAMGLFATANGLARFQSVQTHPDARGRGLAGTLVHHVSVRGLTEYGARALVMVADPEYSAIRVYASLGFATRQTQLQAATPRRG